MEALDRQIVELLATDGRMPLADLAKHTGLSTSAVHARVRKLEERGVVTGYTATIDYRLAGLPVTAFVSLTPIDAVEPDDVPERLAQIAQIESCWSVAGAESFILKVRVAEPSDLEPLLSRIRSVAKCATRTTMVLTTTFEGRPPTLP